MQSPFEGKQPLGVVYNTSMDRPDAALALALLYGFQGKRESRMASVSVNGAGLGAAIFCDIVQRFYTPGPLRNGNQVLMPGLAADGPLPADPVMVVPVVARKEYARSITRLADTSLPEAVIRNGVIFNADAVMILSARATYLAKSLGLDGVKELYKARVKMLVVVDSGNSQDVPAMRTVLADFPAPIIFSGREIGESLPFPGTNIEKDFAWAPNHPIADAYHAFKTGVYDLPSYDLAAALFAVHPDKNFFKVSDTGSISLNEDGTMKFASGPGKLRSLIFDPDRKQEIVDLFVALSSAKPVLPVPRVRRPVAEKK